MSLVDVLDLVAGLGSELTMTTCPVLAVACSTPGRAPILGGKRERTVSGMASRPRPRDLLDAVASSIPPDFRFPARQRGGKRGAKGLDWSGCCVCVCVVRACVWAVGGGARGKSSEGETGGDWAGAVGVCGRTRGSMRALCGASGSQGRLAARSRVARADG